MKETINNLVIRGKSLPLRQRLLVIYSLMVFVPILLLSLWSIRRNTAIVEEQAYDISISYFDQMQRTVSSQIERMSDFSLMISQNTELRRILNTGGDLPFSEEYYLITPLVTDLSSLRDMYDIYQLRIFIGSNFFYSRQKDIIYSLDDLEGEAWYEDILAGKYTQTILPPYAISVPLLQTQEVISTVAAIRSYQNYDTILGVVIVDFPLEDLTALLNASVFSDSSQVWLINGDNETIACFGASESALSEDSLSCIQTLQEQGGDSSSVMQKKNQIYYLSAPIYYNWRIFSVTQNDAFLQSTNSYRVQILLISFLAGLLIYAQISLYSQQITRRITALASQIKCVEQGQFEANCIVDSDDEIGELQSSFNFMVKKIQLLLQEQYTLGQDLKESELEVLQAQINPHFLYNTLDLVFWKATEIGAPQIADIVQKLARYYQLSLNNGNDLSPLENEFEYIRLYVELQNMRFSHPIRLIEELDEELRQHCIMKLVLQPIVENSILHGIQNTENCDGIVELRAQRDGESIRITIRDNGIGMDPYTVEKILARQVSSAEYSGAEANLAQVPPDRPPTMEPETRQSGRGGYGLGNIIQRLQLFYGDSYRLDIRSTPGEGTCFIIHLPLSLPS